MFGIRKGRLVVVVVWPNSQLHRTSKSWTTLQVSIPSDFFTGLIVATTTTTTTVVRHAREANFGREKTSEVSAGKRWRGGVSHIYIGNPPFPPRIDSNLPFFCLPPIRLIEFDIRWSKFTCTGQSANAENGCQQQVRNVYCLLFGIFYCLACWRTCALAHSPVGLVFARL